MTKNLKDILEGFEEWDKKIKFIADLGLPEKDFYTHLVKESLELDAGRDSGEMIDVINCVAMIYASGKYNITFKDCLDKLKQREKKYEQDRETP